MTPLWLELNRWKATPWAWGVMDCMLSISDWCAANGWPDPAEDIRLTYHDRSSCQRVTGFLRDPLTVTERCFETVAGMSVVAVPQVGDVAVLQFGQYEHVGAVWTDVGQWASKDENGVTFCQPSLVPRVLRVWGVGYAG